MELSSHVTVLHDTHFPKVCGMRVGNDAPPELIPKKTIILNPGIRVYFSNFDKSLSTVVQCVSNSWPLLWDLISTFFPFTS